MVPGDSPAVARRRLRLALRKSREAMELTQGQVADALDWSLSKVQRIESGEVSVSSTDLRALMQMLGIVDRALMDQLAGDAKVARRRTAGWWDQPQYRANLTPATMQLLQFEAQATTMRYFAATIIPGILQTRRLAESVFDLWSADLGEMSDQQREARLEVRMRRHGHVFDKPNRPTYLLALDESVLYREVGGPETMAEQLQVLLRYAGEGKVILRVVPYARASAVMFVGPFLIMDLGDEDDAVLYRESWMRDEIVRASEVSQHRRMFDEMWDRSFSQEKSIRLIEARMATLIASVDR